MKLSIVIVSYNVKYFLQQCLQSVERASVGLDVETWVVDNNSKDGSVDLVRNEFPNVHVIANTDNRGFSRANNQAIRQCTGELVLLLNPDTVVDEGCLKTCIEHFQATPSTGGLGVRMIDGTGHFLPESKRGLPTPDVAFYKMSGLNSFFPKHPKFGKYYLSYQDPEAENTVEVLSGAFMMIRKSVLDQIGLLDETYFMYGEDIDLSHRIRLAGFENRYLPQAFIIHYKGESTRKETANYVRAFYGAMVIFAKRYFTKGQAAVLSFLLYPAIYAKAILALISRGLQKALLPVVDASLMFGLMWMLKQYWEHNIKALEGVHYPAIYVQVFIPAYIGIWLTSVFFSGGYDRPFSFWRLIRGIGIGTVFLLAAYGLLSESYRFSRGLIVVGSFFSMVGLSGLRLILHKVGLGEFLESATTNRKTLFVGSGAEANRILSLLQKANVGLRYLGFLSDDEEAGKLGRIDELDRAIEVLQPDELIFMGANCSNSYIIATMRRLANSGIAFKIAPEGSDYVIGSHSVDHPGVLYSSDFDMAIGRPSAKRNKRVFDLLMCIGGVVLLPFGKKIRTGMFWSNWLAVLVGSKTWVGYSNKPGLPGLKPPVFHISEETEQLALSNAASMQYARHWTVWEDWKCLKA